jgi:hypothetical protein
MAMDNATQLLTPSAQFKSFAGGEFLTPKGKISLWGAMHRIELHCKSNGLCRASGFVVDAELASVLGVDLKEMKWDELRNYLITCMSNTKN